MHYPRIDCAERPLWHDERRRPAGVKKLSTGLDHANCEGLMHVWRKREITIIGEQKFRGVERFVARVYMGAVASAFGGAADSASSGSAN